MPLNQMARTVAGFAIPAPLFNLSVFWCVFMSLGEVRFSSLLSDSSRQYAASLHIQEARNRLDVVRVKAPPMRAKIVQRADVRIVARMIQVKPFGNRADERLIGNAMGLNGAAVYPYLPVASIIEASTPKPASADRVYSDSRENALFDGKIGSAHVTLQWSRWLDRTGVTSALRSFLHYTPQNTEVSG